MATVPESFPESNHSGKYPQQQGKTISGRIQFAVVSKHLSTVVPVKSNLDGLVSKNN